MSWNGMVSFVRETPGHLLPNWCTSVSSVFWFLEHSHLEFSTELTVWLSPSWRQRKALAPQRSHNPLDVKTWSSRGQWLTVACDTEVTLSLTLTIVPLTWNLLKQTLVLTFHTGLPQKTAMPRDLEYFSFLSYFQQVFNALTLLIFVFLHDFPAWFLPFSLGRPQLLLESLLPLAGRYPFLKGVEKIQLKGKLDEACITCGTTKLYCTLWCYVRDTVTNWDR